MAKGRPTRRRALSTIWVSADESTIRLWRALLGGRRYAADALLYRLLNNELERRYLAHKRAHGVEAAREWRRSLFETPPKRTKKASVEKSPRASAPQVLE